MKRVFLLFLLPSLAALSGCAMCASCDDYNYAAQGGRWQRVDPAFGRVGSVFSDAGILVTGEPPAPVDAELIETPEPEPLEARQALDETLTF